MPAPKRVTPRGQAAPPVEPVVTGATLPPKPTPTAAKQAHRQKKEAEPGTAYVRNLHHIKARVTLNSGREIELSPRGQREDMDIVTIDEQEDPKFLANYGLIFELVSVVDAKQIIAQQQHNARNVDPLWKSLRDQDGNAFERFIVEEPNQGFVVGTVQQTGPRGAHEQDVNITRVQGAGPQIVSRPGSIGDPATEAMLRPEPEAISADEYQEFLLWKKFKEAQDAAQAEDSTPTTD